ncbi:MULTISPECIES: hypothetical protein [Actinomadura]|uniref:Uncharacterized protein n=1 Tax=Actinomadura yumaensis TaxID=111807 RepID=A0ABW2CIP0_9ACTN|nr:hypothetical protein [Actinomadura sp. J1-007]
MVALPVALQGAVGKPAEQFCSVAETVRRGAGGHAGPGVQRPGGDAAGAALGSSSIAAPRKDAPFVRAIVLSRLRLPGILGLLPVRKARFTFCV